MVYGLRGMEYPCESRVLTLHIDHIRPSPYQPRRSFDAMELNQLADSIAQFGLIQPIAVRRGERGYELVAGERRLRASKLAGLRQIKAVVLDVSEMDAAFITLAENLQRRDLNFFEEAQGFSRMLAHYHLTQTELAQKLALKQSTISNKLRLLRLPPSVQGLILDCGLSERHARALLRLGDEQGQYQAARRIGEQELSVQQAEALIQRMLKEYEREEAREKPRPARVTGVWRDWRLFANSMKTAVGELQARGLNARFVLAEEEDEIEMKIVVPKRRG